MDENELDDAETVENKGQENDGKIFDIFNGNEIKHATDIDMINEKLIKM